MALKQEIKLSEAKILVFLDKSDKRHHFVRKIATKLDQDYGYIWKILLNMFEKDWLIRVKSQVNQSRTYYELSGSGKSRVQKAMDVIEHGTRTKASNES